MIVCFVVVCWVSRLWVFCGIVGLVGFLVIVWLVFVRYRLFVGWYVIGLEILGCGG